MRKMGAHVPHPHHAEWEERCTVSKNTCRGIFPRVFQDAYSAHHTVLKLLSGRATSGVLSLETDRGSKNRRDTLGGLSIAIIFRTYFSFSRDDSTTIVRFRIDRRWDRLRWLKEGPLVVAINHADRYD